MYVRDSPRGDEVKWDLASRGLVAVMLWRIETDKACFSLN